MKATELALSAATLTVLTLVPAMAQQTTGIPGAPNATTTIDGRYLPPPDQPFQGEINLNAAQSKPYWPARIVPPRGAPNILLILTDDVGFGAPSTFGGVIPTPALDRIAANGLSYTNFHTTGDNGASAEGTPNGTPSAHRTISSAEQLAE
jgi:arylsulfatase